MIFCIIPSCLMVLFILGYKVMKLLFVYSTWHGTVLKVAKEIISLMDGPADLYDIEKSKIPSLDEYDCIIIGCSVHDGHIQESIRNFISDNCPVSKIFLAGFFCCSIMGDEKTRKVLDRDIASDVLTSFKILGLMGGMIYAKKLSFVERRILRQISFDETMMKTLDDVKIRKFARNFQEQYLVMEKEKEELRKNNGRVHYKAKKPIT